MLQQSKRPQESEDAAHAPKRVRGSGARPQTDLVMQSHVSTWRTEGTNERGNGASPVESTDSGRAEASVLRHVAMVSQSTT